MDITSDIRTLTESKRDTTARSGNCCTDGEPPGRIFFTIEGSTVQVLHVRRGSRDYRRPQSGP